MSDTLPIDITDDQIDVEFKSGTSDVKKVLHTYRYLCHDGYDDDGPESNLYDLFLLVITDNNKFQLYWYHGEEWYTGVECKYELEGIYNLNDASELRGIKKRMSHQDYQKMIDIMHQSENCDERHNKIFVN
jgi:hypothetical protein